MEKPKDKTPQEIKHEIIVAHLKLIIKNANICLAKLETKEYN